MADDSNSSQEKSEQATPRKLQQAREKGQVPRSKELVTMLLVFAGTVIIAVAAGPLTHRLIIVFRSNLELDRDTILDETRLLFHLSSAFNDIFSVVGMVLFGLFIIGAIGYIAVGGWLLTGKSMVPKIDRLNPISGIGRMFSVKSLVELLKAIAKVILIASCGLFMLWLMQDRLLNLANKPLEAAIIDSMWIIALCVLGTGLSLVVIAAIDVPFQLWEHQRQLKMTLQEVKDEFKETEGRPEVRSRVRQLQREIAERKMLEQVPKADVVITNPTHFAVALCYQPEKSDAPYLVAKGVDEVAARIRDCAKSADVTIVEAPALARAVYHNTRLNQTIPKGLYVAVAQVLAYVYQLKRYRSGQGHKPGTLSDFDIPDELSGPSVE